MDHQVTESETEQGIRVVCHYLDGNINSYKEIEDFRPKSDYKKSDDIAISHEEETILDMKMNLIIKFPPTTVRYYFKVYKYVKYTMIKNTFQSKTYIIHR